MASTFSLTSPSYDGRYMTLSCSQSKDVETNKSTITWTLTSTGGKDKYYSTGPTTVKINGTEVYYCDRKDWTTKTFPAAKGSLVKLPKRFQHTLCAYNYISFFYSSKYRNSKIF